MPQGKSQDFGFAERQSISFSPDDFESGLIDDIDATITSVDCVTWDYNGHAKPAPALKIGFKPDDAESFEQYYSAGSLDRLIPADDGSTFYRAKGTGAKLGNGSNSAAFIISMVEAGFPKSRIAVIRDIVGTHGHFARVPQQERAGLANPVKTGDRPKTVLVCKSIDRLPWEGEEAAPAKQQEAAPPPLQGRPSAVPSQSPKTNGEDIFTKAVQYVTEALKKQGPLPLNRLGMEIYSSVGNGAMYRREMIRYVESAEFLSNPELPFTVDTKAGVISL